MNYGFVTRDNPFDSFAVARSTEQLAALIAALVGGLRDTRVPPDQALLQRAADRAVEEVLKAQEEAELAEGWAELMETGPQYDVAAEEPLFVFGNGAVDARLLAAVAAMAHVVMFERGERGREEGEGEGGELLGQV